MKILYITFGKIKDLISRNTFIFIILCVGIYASNLMFTYFWGNMKYTAERAGTLIIEVYNENDQQLTSNEIGIQLLKYNAKNVYFVSVYTGTEELPLNYTKTINDAGDVLISYGMSENSSMSPIYFYLELNAHETTNIKCILEFIQANYGNTYEMQETETVDVDFFNRIFVLLLVYIISLISLLLLMTYLYEDYAYELSVYEILGATRAKVTAILSLVQLALLIFIGTCAQLSHWVLYNSIFERLNWTENIKYTIGDYLSVIIISVILVWLSITVYISVKVKNSAIVNSKTFTT